MKLTVSNHVVFVFVPVRTDLRHLLLHKVVEGTWLALVAPIPPPLALVGGRWCIEHRRRQGPRLGICRHSPPNVRESALKLPSHILEELRRHSRALIDCHLGSSRCDARILHATCHCQLQTESNSFLQEGPTKSFEPFVNCILLPNASLLEGTPPKGYDMLSLLQCATFSAQAQHRRQKCLQMGLACCCPYMRAPCRKFNYRRPSYCQWCWPAGA